VPKITQVGEIFGTPSYMAPEQTVSATTDIRTDLYAVGILLYEMLTGLRPFVGRNPVAIIQQQLVTPPPPMKERAPTVQVPADMEALVMRLLAKQPAQRFQTPEELIQAIDQIGAVHHLAWPGSDSAAHPVVPGTDAASSRRGLSKLTLRLSTVRSRLSGTLGKLRAHPGGSRLSRRGLVAAALLVALLLGIALWRILWTPERTLPESAPPGPAVVTPATPTTIDVAPTPTRRGTKHRQRGDARP
jgi:serine/threonine protein kinase